ncbi:DUF1569 domain-containing protein [Chitinophaga oryziterrae]|uniref:DUF1569 domain-containing protein n=1 Tax=Chitinophaga oryziterrae TaxID=1031224 RepID=A0A6N8JGC3_9BACT|nr:DUF1569 domain-containing protein [Chitinophaga oryziterrae]MVT43376.1 DUF1569 domain-containing protein [Chitinophaga oryziterrae]
MFIDINNRKELLRLFQCLTPDAVPLWGKMNPQEMVEHLTDQVEYTNGTKIPTCDKPAEEAYESKLRMLKSNKELPKNVFLGELPALIYPDIETAVHQLMVALDDFDAYFKIPGNTAIHGGFGPMDYNEWLIWHGRHFTHHLKQFGLIK